VVAVVPLFAVGLQGRVARGLEKAAVSVSDDGLAWIGSEHHSLLEGLSGLQVLSEEIWAAVSLRICCCHGLLDARLLLLVCAVGQGRGRICREETGLPCRSGWLCSACWMRGRAADLCRGRLGPCWICSCCAARLLVSRSAGGKEITAWGRWAVLLAAWMAAAAQPRGEVGCWGGGAAVGGCAMLPGAGWRRPAMDLRKTNSKEQGGDGECGLELLGLV